ncbi:hypothetical protein FGG08_005836 [Glutinoglossum americanum]|uniref:DUF6594 domain-containing protein n=1 Tax=Glutinoglossum americanum TaxID=1670608 RepID=A0A9P8I6H7_9PEZI|nr:hypothetical protein FGG08_005836 [Glutinoglossum americanum]
MFFSEKETLGPTTPGDLEAQNEKVVPQSPSASTETTVVGGDGLNSPQPSKQGRFSTFLRTGTFTEDRGAAWRKGIKMPLPEQYTRKIDNEPAGYPQLAAFLDSDPNFTMCRRFGVLHTRLLLYRQDELRDLERRLAQVDREDSLTEEGQQFLASREMDEEHRQDLIDEIDQKLKAYDELVLRCQSLIAMRQPAKRNFRSLTTWVDNEKPLCVEEMDFIHQRQDFVTLAAEREDGWFDGLVEDALMSIPCRFTKILFSSKSQREKTDDRYVHYVSKKRLDMLIRVLLMFFAVALLVVPVFILLVAKREGYLRVVIVLLFTGAFSMALSVFTKARRHEVFAATAA